MPRRIQDYPFGYAGWHSVATTGHLVVVLGLLMIMTLLAQSTYFKRGMLGRHRGFPVIASRAGWVVHDKMCAATAVLSGQFIGIRPIRKYLIG